MSDTMNTGCVARNMGIPITEDKLTELGFKPVGTDKRARMWAVSDFPDMCKAVGKSISDRAGIQLDLSPKPPATRKPKTGATGLPPTNASGTLPLDDPNDF